MKNCSVWNRNLTKTLVICTQLFIGLTSSAAILAADQADSAAPSSSSQLPPFPALIVDPITFDEPYDTGWQLYFDNDLFAGTDTDRDYTGGFALAFSGRRAREWRLSLDPWLDRIDSVIGIQDLQLQIDGFQRNTIEFGLLLFTPEDLTITSPQPKDHPFGNFLFVANSQQVIFSDKRLILQSALTLGLIGTNVGPTAQNLIHSVTGSETARGWNNQISAGGELTGRYSVVAQKNLYQRYGRFSYEFTGALEGNAGLNTDVSLSLVTRFGQLKSPWWSFVPHQSDYINLGQTITSRLDDRRLPAELFGWAGIKVKYVAYNGLLQGQFRESAVSFNRNELENDVYEGWLGITKTWSSGFGLSFVARSRTGEIKGPKSRNPLWSGFIVSFTS